MSTAKRTAYTVEFFFRTTPSLLYQYIATPSGLQRWFAEKVTVKGKEYTFTWEGSEERAEMIERKRNQYIKFRWVDREGDEYLYMELIPDELTGDTVLAITDFDNEDQLEDARQIWKTAIDELHQVVGG